MIRGSKSPTITSYAAIPFRTTGGVRLVGADTCEGYRAGPDCEEAPNYAAREVVRLFDDDWPLANYDMASALAYKEYDYQFMFGEGGHSLKHGGAAFPDTLRWLWRDYPKNK